MTILPVTRRKFVAALSIAATWPVVTRAEQTRRIGVLMGWDQTDPRVQAGFAGFRQRLAELGWTEGANLHIDLRWTDADVNRAAFLAKELVAPARTQFWLAPRPLHPRYSTRPTISRLSLFMWPTRLAAAS